MKDHFKFEDLPAVIQNELINNNRSAYADQNSSFINENFSDSKRKFEEVLGVSPFSNHSTLLDEDLRGIRLATWLVNHIYPELVSFKVFSLNHNKNYKHRTSKILVQHSCVLTGVCTDDSFTKPILDFIKKPDDKTSLDDLIYECNENARVDEQKWNESNYDDDESIKDFVAEQQNIYSIEGEIINSPELELDLAS